MDKFYVVNDKPELYFTANGTSIIYKTPSAAFRARKLMNKLGSDKLRVYEVISLCSLMTDGFNFREVDNERKESKV